MMPCGTEVANGKILVMSDVKEVVLIGPTLMVTVKLEVEVAEVCGSRYRTN